MAVLAKVLLGVGALAAWLLPRKAEASSPASSSAPVTPVNVGDDRPRGIRNNNPGNIEFSSRINWRGQLGHDGRYVVFDSALNGLRALALEIYDSIARDGDDTIRTLLLQWAPPGENNTGAYIASVVSQTGIGADVRLDYRRDVAALVPAIVRHENGEQPYGRELIDQAIRAAGK